MKDALTDRNGQGDCFQPEFQDTEFIAQTLVPEKLKSQ